MKTRALNWLGKRGDLIFGNNGRINALISLIFSIRFKPSDAVDLACVITVDGFESLLLRHSLWLMHKLCNLHFLCIDHKFRGDKWYLKKFA